MTVSDRPAPPDASSSSPSITRIARIEVLTSAWDTVLDGDREDGVLAHGVARFAEDADERITGIADALLAGTYRPDRLTPIPLIRPDGRTRLLHVPSVRDRVVERALLGVLTPLADPWLGPFSYAYRPGLGVADAVQAVTRLREEGLRWVCRCDIDDCFPSIPVPLLRRKIAALLDDPELTALIGNLLARVGSGGGGNGAHSLALSLLPCPCR